MFFSLYMLYPLPYWLLPYLQAGDIMKTRWCNHARILLLTKIYYMKLYWFISPFILAILYMSLKYVESESISGFLVWFSNFIELESLPKKWCFVQNHLAVLLPKPFQLSVQHSLCWAFPSLIYIIQDLKQNKLLSANFYMC